MTKTFKPLLAPTDPLQLADIKLPVMASAKLDGFRLLNHPEKGPVTRSLLPLANIHVREAVGDMRLTFADGEILTYTDGVQDEFETVQSKLTTRAGRPEFKFHAFDHFELTSLSFVNRFGRLNDVYTDKQNEFFTIHPHRLIADMEELILLEAECVEAGYEGMMTRRPDGPYKFGRSTVNEAILLKVKRWYDSEGIVVGYVEGETNVNAAGVDELGHTKRSTAKAGKVKNGMLGALEVEWEGIQFSLSGFTKEKALELWNERESLPGRLVNFSFQGRMKSGAPRFPKYRGFRDRSDLAAA